MRPHLCHRLSDFVCLFEFETDSRVKGKLRQRYSWGGGLGGVIPERGVRKGAVFKNLGLFGQRCNV